MSEKKKNIMSKTESLLTEMSGKMDKLLEAVSKLVTIIENQTKISQQPTQQQTVVMPPVAKPKIEAKK